MVKTCSPSLKKWRWHIILVVAIIIVIFILTAEPQDKSSESFSIKDQCGPLPGGVLSHSIEADDVCRVQCRNLCRSKDLEMERYMFSMPPNSCYLCDCFCS